MLKKVFYDPEMKRIINDLVILMMPFDDAMALTELLDSIEKDFKLLQDTIRNKVAAYGGTFDEKGKPILSEDKQLLLDKEIENFLNTELEHKEITIHVKELMPIYIKKLKGIVKFVK